MKRAISDAMILTNYYLAGSSADYSEPEKVVGINFGADFVSEHEQGISGISTAFGVIGKPERSKAKGQGVDSDFVGIDVRKITKVPKELILLEDIRGYSYLIFSPRFTAEPLNKSRLDLMMGIAGNINRPFESAWDRNSFALRMASDTPGKGSVVLKQIYEAFQRNDVVLLMANFARNRFGHAGLVILIHSLVPQELADEIKHEDVAYLDLMAAADEIQGKTALFAKLSKAEKRFYTLAPRWADDIARRGGSPMGGKYKVVYFLNPEDQANNNFGYFTVEELLDWARGKGPIPKNHSVDNAKDS